MTKAEEKRQELRDFVVDMVETEYPWPPELETPASRLRSNSKAYVEMVTMARNMVQELAGIQGQDADEQWAGLLEFFRDIAADEDGMVTGTAAWWARVLSAMKAGDQSDEFLDLVLMLPGLHGATYFSGALGWLAAQLAGNRQESVEQVLAELRGGRYS